MDKKKKILLGVGIGVLVLAAVGSLIFLKGVKKTKLMAQSLFALDKVAKFLPIEADTKKEIEVMDKLVQSLTQEDGQERKYLVLLQNNMELRPGGGFLGQYAILKIKNGEITSTFVEDANLLDKRIEADVTPPYPFEKMMSIKRWKFRDANFSPDFPTNVEKVAYFYKLAGGANSFDGTIAVNADVFSDLLEITGPIQVPGYSGQYTSDNAVLKLEEQVERGFEAQGIAVENRKLILKKMAEIMVERLSGPSKLPAVSKLVLEELRNRSVQLNFKDEKLQSLAEEVHWAGKVNQEWKGDYLMAVDANLGALKSDYYMKRSMEYEVDLTGEKPVATLLITYKHTATAGDWRTTDYHSYLRVYAPAGANLLERKMVSYPNVQDDLGKTSMGFILHVIMGQETQALIKYELPQELKEGYELLVQKQSGVGEVPIKVKVKTENGEFEQEEVLKNYLKFGFKL